MPKQTITISDFSGGLNESGDQRGKLEKKQVEDSLGLHYDREGYVSLFDRTTSFADEEIKTPDASVGDITGDFADLDRGIGHETPSDSTALDMAIGTIGSPSDDLSWEDGTYNFRYTVCNDLGNGIIEEGPLQKFEGLADGADMSADDKATFTFSVTGDDDPSHMDGSYATALKICGRVYYARVSGQGNSTQPGYIHLCDLIYTHTTDNDRIQPRAIGGIGDPATDVISIEEPPTSASFEMNAGYPSDVGILDVAVSPFADCEAKVKLGMVTYIAKSGYIYRSVPGQPDIFPTDNWIDMTTFGTSTPCKTMFGIGNLLCYFTANELVLFDVMNDSIVKIAKGHGIEYYYRAAKVAEGIVWYIGGGTFNATVYYFDGNTIKDLGGSKLESGFAGGPITYPRYNRSKGWLQIKTGYFYYYYSFKTNTWFKTDVDGVNEGTTFLQLPLIELGSASRYKKIYKLIFHGDVGSIVIRDNEWNSISGTTVQTGAAGDRINTWTPDSSLKIRGLYIQLTDIGLADSTRFSAVSIVYRNTSKF